MRPSCTRAITMWKLFDPRSTAAKYGDSGFIAASLQHDVVAEFLLADFLEEAREPAEEIAQRRRLAPGQRMHAVDRFAFDAEHGKVVALADFRAHVEARQEGHAHFQKHHLPYRIETRAFVV